MADQRAIEQIIAGIYGSGERAVTVIGLEVHARLVELTPLDTGNARASWVPSVTRPFTDQVSNQDHVSRAAQEAGVAHVIGYKLSDGQVWDTNNADYIEDLDGGSSDQAPSGFVRIAVEEGVRAGADKLGPEINVGSRP